MSEEKFDYVYPGTDITIQDVQNIELDMLIEVDRICRKHNIPYQIYSGTLLGAVRHKGFIPWDDDIDVAMLRKDYDKFIQVAERELDSSMFLQTCFTDPESIVQFAKIRKNGTIYEYIMDVGTNYHKGIWIDIVPFDNVKLDSFNVLIMSFKIKFLYTWTTSSVITRINAGGTLLRRFIRKIFHFTGKIIGKNNIDKMILKECTKFNDIKTEYVTFLTNGISSVRFNDYENKKGKTTYLMRYEDFTNICELEFCGHKFFAPKNYDKILKNFYGDYMTIPPLSKRNPPHETVNVKLHS